MGPIAAEAAGIEINMTGRRACEAIDQAIDGTAGARLGDIEADTVAVAVDALPPQRIRRAAFSPELKQAWSALYDAVQGEMIRATRI